MRHLRWAGLVFSLSIVGVLAGLMAPASSEASSTSLTLQVDSGTPVNILGASTSCPTGYNQCYLMNFNAANAVGSNSRSFKVSTAPGTSSTVRKLMINDTASDSMKFNGFQIAPTSTSSWPNTETHVLKIVAKNTYDATPNLAGNYTLGLSVGGYVQAAGGTSPLYTQYDWIQYSGTGTFSPSLVNVPMLGKSPATTNLTPLKLAGIANQASITYFTLSQVLSYPTFGCDADGTASGTQCKPIITITLTATVYGPDTVVVTSSGIMETSGPCKLTPADPGITEPTGNPIPCHASGKKKSASDSIALAIETQVNEDIAAGKAAGGVLAVQCVEADNCPCADPYDPQCAGTIVNVVKVTPATVATFPFTATGPGIDPPNYVITTDAEGNGSNTFTPLPAIGEGSWTFVKGVFPPAGPNHEYDVDNISCVSTLEPQTPVFTTWTLPTGPVKDFVTVNTLKGGDTLTCTWHIHKTSIN
jgi:hypothetical protein